jgi:peptide/nickel transport system substrate-binding protein
VRQVLNSDARAAAFNSRALGLSLLVLVVPACTSSARHNTVPPSPELRLGVTQGTSGSDPSSGAIAAAGLLNEEGLTVVGQDGHARPRIADTFRHSKNGLEWTFVLRSNVMFHDGSIMTPEDVKAFILRKKEEGQQSLRDLEQVSVIAPNEVLIRLRRPAATLPEDFSTAMTKDVDGRSIATGPFKIVSKSPAEIVLERNEHYYTAVPQLARITLKAYPNFRQAYAKLLRGEIDGVYDIGQEPVEFLKDESSIQLYPFQRPFITAILLNNSLPMFRDPRVRQALNMAVDRREVVEVGLRSQGTEARTAVQPGHWAFDERRAGFAFDPARAQALLDAAGMTGHPRLKVTCLVPDVFETWELIALLVQRQLAQVGIDITLESVTYNEFRKRIQAGDFQAVLMEMVQGPGMNILSRFWHSKTTGGIWNTWNYSSAAMDGALDSLISSVGNDGYRHGVSLVQQALMDDPPAVFLAWREVTRALSRRFEVTVEPGHDIRETISSWTLAGQPQVRRTN